MKNLLKIFCLAAIVASCDDVEPTIFHGEDPSNLTLLSFSSDVYSLPVERDANGVTTVTFNSSTVSNSDRVYNVEIISGTANAATYSVPSTITIPAGQYQGIIDITGQDNNLVDDEVKTFKIKIADSDFGDESIGFAEAEVRVYEVCPLEADFTGNYVLTPVTSMFNNAAIFATEDVVLNVGVNAYERTFRASPYPTILNDKVVFAISFKCDVLDFSGTFDSGLICVEDGTRTIVWGASDNSSSYDTTNDAIINVSFTEDSANACGNGSSATSSRFRLTKTN
ncbi:hypothetical protein V1389_12945 [Flavobacterium rakeshii]|uniref:hypothetical protein n=1 Tax=Flavobacterium rakeshii TaxID=1038845 RepID=UPI002E7ADE80|nr:hypothetical protein [Flavobacterium rakeshii]MEE1899254.1 hypothetical protein [Flavobacterium rakeshii]